MTPHKHQGLTKDIGQIPVVARLALSTPSARTYYALKARDKRGQGFVTFAPIEFCQEMGYTRSTLYRHLNNQKLFRCVSNSASKPKQWLRNADGTLTVYMRGTAKVLALYGHNAVGAVFLMSTLEVSSPWALKCRSAEAVVKQGQNQAYYALCRAYKGKAGHEVIPDQDVVKSFTQKERQTRQDSHNMGGPNVSGSRFFRLHYGQYAGAKSAKSNAEELDRSVDSLRRYLDNDTRSKVGISPMQSRRLIKTLSESEQRQARAISNFFAESHELNPTFFPMPVQKSHTRKKERRQTMMVGNLPIGSDSGFYEMLPKIYGTEIQLLRYRSQRKALKRTTEATQ